ncbi:hypothetical protein ROHU_028366 [Labeo rohita]|uniref:Uncharacterized protein n=1 Tax=Labeo rohita TaxID=84645 RepID=A0A498M720_LABRO|nr:hypothetical protein ROHU_028366 [Labeo rohita]
MPSPWATVARRIWYEDQVRSKERPAGIPSSVSGATSGIWQNAARVKPPPSARVPGRTGQGASSPGTARAAPATPEGGLRGRWSFYPPSGYQYIPGRIRPAAVGGGVLERPQPHASMTLVGTGVGGRPLLRDLTDLRRRGC